ncbi:MAG: oligosaccharide flippase family protein [Candidatus Altimarinota bacterium]
MFKKIASNTIAQILSKFLTAFISIFLIGVLTKYLSTEMYGQYNKIYNYLAFFAFFADLGLYTISIREISKDKTQASKIIGNVMSLRLILGVLIIFLSIFIAFFLPGYSSELMLISILIVSIFTIFSLLNSSVLSLMQAFMKIEFSLFSVVFGKLVTFLGILLVVFILFPYSQTQNFEMAFIGILLSGLVGVIINYILNLYYANKITKIKFLFDFEYMKYLFKTSLPFGIALFLSVVYFKVDIIILSLLEPPSQADTSIALYSLPMKIIEVLMVIGGFFLNSILPSLSTYFKEQNIAGMKLLLQNSFRFLFSFSLFIIVAGFIFGEHILTVISTPDYMNHNLYQYTSLDVLLVVLLVLGFYFISSLFNYIFIASKNESILLKINIFITLFNIIGNIIFIPKYSFMGAAYVTLTSQILLFLLGWYFSKNISHFRFDWKYIILNFLIGIFIFLLGNWAIGFFHLGFFMEMFLIGGILFGIYILLCGFLNFDVIKKKL